MNNWKNISKKEINRIKKMVYESYEKDGVSGAIDTATAFNKNHVVEIPMESCAACDTVTPSINHECLCCGQATTRVEPQMEIKVSGSGTLPEIIEALERLVKSVKASTEGVYNFTAMGCTSNFEDSTLMTTIKHEN